MCAQAAVEPARCPADWMLRWLDCVARGDLIENATLREDRSRGGKL